MIKITKVSARKYEVFAIEENLTYLIYTIKRLHHDKYIVRSMNDDVLVFPSLQQAKEFLRYDKTDKDVNWLSFFVRHTKGKKFDSQQDSNQHMKLLSRKWKETKVNICSFENGCICK